MVTCSFEFTFRSDLGENCRLLPENGVDGMRACPRLDALSSQYALEVQKETGNEEG